MQDEVTGTTVIAHQNSKCFQRATMTASSPRQQTTTTFEGAAPPQLTHFTTLARCTNTGEDSQLRRTHRALHPIHATYHTSKALDFRGMQSMGKGRALAQNAKKNMQGMCRPRWKGRGGGAYLTNPDLRYPRRAGNVQAINETTAKRRKTKALTLRNLDDGGDELLKEAVDLQKGRPVVVHKVDQQP